MEGVEQQTLVEEEEVELQLPESHLEGEVEVQHQEDQDLEGRWGFPEDRPWQGSLEQSLTSPGD